MKRTSKGRSEQRIPPEDLLHFIELKGFERDWSELGLKDSDLTELQLTIMRGGKLAPLVKNTGGLRKLRFAPEILEYRQARGYSRLFRLLREIRHRDPCRGLRQE